jgi:uncharacterized protein
MNSPDYFEIQADDIERAKHFYSTLFKWKFAKAENLPVAYWRIETEGARGGLLSRPAPVPPPRSGTNAFVCSMQVEDLDAMAETILSLDGQIALPKFAVPGLCWQGYFIDTEGNTFGLFQVDEEAK